MTCFFGRIKIFYCRNRFLKTKLPEKAIFGYQKMAFSRQFFF